MVTTDKQWQYENRWVIEGTLTTLERLHIGCGDTERKAVGKKKKESANGNGEMVEITLVTRDHRGKTFIPGSTLKGNLRHWLSERVDDPRMTSIFGSRVIKKDEAVIGGKVEFHSGFLLQEPPEPCRTRHYDPASATDLAVGIAIDRASRTVSDQKLFHCEIVPAGTVYGVTITGQNLDEEEITLLLQGLNGFNDEQAPLGLGMGTADGWGKMKWNLNKVSFVGREEARAWLLARESGCGYGISGRDRTDELRELSKVLLPKSRDAVLDLELELAFSGPFLVNDPARRIDDGPGKTADHVPRIGVDGRAVLPASSFRGALRSQAERIVRTIGRRACRVDDNNDRCRPIYSEKERASLCPVCRTFGAAGWRTPLEIPDFVQSSPASELTQEFVAIDRFTGGGRDGAKFNAQAVVSPTFRGRLRIDLERLTSEEIGLLALTVRDLLEGDITFGFGSAKGYGACTATVVAATASSLPEWLPIDRQGGLGWKQGDDGTHILATVADCVRTFCEVN